MTLDSVFAAIALISAAANAPTSTPTPAPAGAPATVPAPVIFDWAAQTPAMALAMAGDDFARPTLHQISFELAAGYRYGAIDGSLQTGDGGEPGTTSPQRPTLDEIGVDDVSIFDIAFEARWRPHVLAVGAQIIRLSADATLDQALMSQNHFFPAGSRVTGDVKLDWYRIGYRYEFEIDLRASGQRLTIAPGADAAIFDFHYTLDGPAGQSVDRSYAKVGMRIGAQAEWQINERLSLEAGAFLGLGITNMPEVTTAEAVLTWRLWGSRENGGTVFAGVAYQTIEYQDQQEVPNHIDIQMGPLLIAGLRIEF